MCVASLVVPWQHWARQSARARVARVVALRWRRLGMARGLRHLQSTASAGLRSRRLLRRAIDRFCSTGQGKALAALDDERQRAAWLRGLSERAIAGSLRRALATWSCGGLGDVRDGRLMTRAARRWLHRQWVRCIERMRRGARQRVSMRAALTRWCERSYARCWCSWTAAVFRQRAHVEALALSVFHLLHASQRQCWSRWAAWVLHRRAGSRLMAHGTSRWLYRCFRRWHTMAFHSRDFLYLQSCEFLQLLQLWSDSLALASGQQAQALRSCSRRAERIALHAWCVSCGRNRRLRQAARRFMCHAQAIAFVRWVHASVFYRMRSHLEQYANWHYTQMRCLLCLRMWAASSALSLAEVSTMECAIASFVNPSKRRSFNAWREHALVMALLRRSVRRLEGSATARCFDVWRTWVAVRHTVEERLSRCAVSCRCASCFHVWAAATTRSTPRRLIQRSLARWIHGALHRAFGLLLAEASARHYSSHLLCGALLFFRAQALVAAVRVWRSYGRFASRVAFAQMAGVLHQWQRTPVRARLAEAQSCITQLSFADSTVPTSGSALRSVPAEAATNQLTEAEAQFAILSAWVQWLGFCTRAKRLQSSRHSVSTQSLRTRSYCKNLYLVTLTFAPLEPNGRS